MMRRCYDTSNSQYSNYGGRDITVSDHWDSFWNFVEDVGLRPEFHSLDRINNDLGYSKDNCKWSSDIEQARNTTKYKGFCISQDSRSVARGHSSTWKAQVYDSQGKAISKRFKTEEDALQWVTQYSLLNSSHTILLEKYRGRS